MTYKGKWPGTWATNCDVCGFRFPSDKLKLRWDGVRACEKDWETRHPQTLIKVRGETAVPEYTRHSPLSFLEVCDMWGSSALADFMVADCGKADVPNNIDVLFGAMPPWPCVADLAIASLSIPGYNTVGVI